MLPYFHLTSRVWLYCACISIFIWKDDSRLDPLLSSCRMMLSHPLHVQNEVTNFLDNYFKIFTSEVKGEKVVLARTLLLESLLNHIFWILAVVILLFTRAASSTAWQPFPLFFFPLTSSLNLLTPTRPFPCPTTSFLGWETKPCHWLHHPFRQVVENKSLLTLLFSRLNTLSSLSCSSQAACSILSKT